jgi:hypothetical protein
MEINSAIAKGYVMNAHNRRHKCEKWSEWLGLMPIGEPITATQLAERISRAHDGAWYFTQSWQSVSAMLNAVKATGVVMRMEVAIEPYEIEVETRRRWSSVHNCYVEGGMKKITIDKKTVFIRMV